MRNLTRISHAALLVAFFSLVGCSLMTQPDEPTYLIVTSEPTATLPGPSPTPPPPTVPPTPTVVPELAVADGDRYLLNGYYEDAVQTYRAVLLQGDAAGAARASAAYGMGKAALREGLFQDAVDALTILISQFPDSAQTPQAYFLRGEAYLGLSRWADAISDFQTYLSKRSGLIDSYVYERIGDAQLGLGQQSEAFASYEQAASASRTAPQLALLRERIAQVHTNNNAPLRALEQYDAILAVAQNAPYRASIELLAARAMLSAGQTDEAMARMQRIFNEYPQQPEAYEAMLALIANGIEPDALEQARVAFAHGDYEYTIQVLNTYTTTHQLAAVPAELHMLLGRSYRELGNPAAAVTAFETVIAQYPQDPLFGDALLEQGRTKFLSGDIPGAIQHYLFIADNYGYLPQAAEALWRAGYLYGTNDNPAESRAVFERLADTYPNTEQARSGLFLAASSAMAAGDNAGAERLYGLLAVTTTGEDQAAAYFTAARLALQRGDTRTAEDAFAAAIAAAPDSYYSARAQDIQAGREAFQSPASYRFEFDEQADMAEAEAWLRTTFGIEQEGALSPLSETVQADPRLVRGVELWEVAAYDEANSEFDDLLEAFKADALSSYQLALFMRDLGAYYQSIVAAANIIRAANVGTLDAPPLIARMRYPAYYADVVERVAQERGFDPLLLLSLIRHESLFDTTATAAAGEKGLTQVIPSTGEYIATQLGWPDYQHSDLFRPYAGIAFGAYYLDEQLELFDGNVVAALSAYNAGPGRALNWLQLSGGDPDLFMTAITIDSTRTYVQRIYGYFTIYRALYGVS